VHIDSRPEMSDVELSPIQLHLIKKYIYTLSFKLLIFMFLTKTKNVCQSKFDDRKGC
jgi:hypothetical protein